MDVAQAFERLAENDAEMTGARLDEVIRLIPGKRGIFAGRFGGQRAIFRFYLDHPQAHAERDWAELQRTYPYMSDGDSRVNAPLCYRPELGLIVVARVEGTPLMERIRQANPAERPGFLAPAAAWLRKYTSPTEKGVPVRLDGWFGRVDKAMARQPHAELCAVEAAIRAEMRRIAEPHAGGTWRVAISHGDFHPNNLLASGRRLTAIDTGGSAKLPIYKDMARFLAHMGRRGLLPSGQGAFGVDRAGIDAFARAFDLDRTERDIWLPFMVGVEALKRAEPPSLPPARIRQAKAFHEAVLEGLRGIPA